MTTFSAGCVRVWRAVVLELEARDVLFVGGLGMVGYGLAEVWPPVAWIVVGGVLAGVGYAGGRGAASAAARDALRPGVRR